MSYTTDNYEFTVPEIDDIPDISVLSQNWDNLDRILNGIDTRNKIETISPTVDLNGYTEQGIYRFTSSHIPTNVPLGCTEGWLFVVPWNNAYEAVQFWLNYADRKVYIRKRVYPTWGEWNGLTTSSELSDIYNQLHGAIESNTALIMALQAAIGSPLVASFAESMTDQTKVYVYTGTTTSSLTNGHWYYYDNGWTDGGVYNSFALETDKTLTIPNMAPDSEVVGGEITDLKSDLTAMQEEIDSFGGLSDEVKQALLACFQKVGWKDESGDDCYDALHSALYPDSFTPIGGYEIAVIASTIWEDRLNIQSSQNRLARPTYFSLTQGDVVGFSDSSLYAIYAFAFAPRTGENVDWNVPGGTYGYAPAEDFTITVTSDHYYSILKRYDNADMTDNDVKIINRSFGIKSRLEEG